jgi:hypothetical protein
MGFPWNGRRYHEALGNSRHVEARTDAAFNDAADFDGSSELIFRPFPIFSFALSRVFIVLFPSYLCQVHNPPFWLADTY